MADKSSDQEKTEEPTSKRIEKAREEGNVMTSKEVTSIILLSAALLTMAATGKKMYLRVTYLFESFFYNSGTGFEDQSQVISYLHTALFHGLQIVMPTLSVLLVMSVGINMAQTKGLFTLKALAFKGNKMNPIEGIKKLLSTKGLVELLKGVVKLGIIVAIANNMVNKELNNFVAYIISPIETSMADMGAHILSFIIKILAALLILSIADAVYQQYNYKKQLKMTKQEIKDEYKQMEGDPQVKSWRKRFGMKLRSQKRMDHAVLASDVVVTNPTHYAVALKYDPNVNGAPLVMLKGQRKRAHQIKEYAKHYGIPIVENKPVARALYATAEEDEFIPEQLYRAVAEILAYVFKLKNKQKVNV